MSAFTYEAMPLPTCAGVSVPRQGMRLAMHRTGDGAHRGIGFIDILAGVAGQVIGGFFGADSESRQLSAQREMMQIQANAQTAIARMQASSQDRSVEAAMRTAEIQSRNERIAIETAYAANLSQQRMQKQVAEEGLATQLVSGTQAGIFGLAKESISQSGQVARAFPRAGTTAATLMVVGTVVALAWSMKKPKRARRRAPPRPKVDAIIEEPTL